MTLVLKNKDTFKKPRSRAQYWGSILAVGLYNALLAYSIIFAYYLKNEVTISIESGVILASALILLISGGMGIHQVMAGVRLIYILPGQINAQFQVVVASFVLKLVFSDSVAIEDYYNEKLAFLVFVYAHWRHVQYNLNIRDELVAGKIKLSQSIHQIYAPSYYFIFGLIVGGSEYLIKL